jgi:hypothetical protein
MSLPFSSTKEQIRSEMEKLGEGKVVDWINKCEIDHLRPQHCGWNCVILCVKRYKQKIKK